MKLIIVESPTKAKTFNKFLDPKKYLVISSMGHIRDLPKKKLGIDLTQDFKPEYEPLANKTSLIKEIIKLAKKAEEVILATDLDREGEAIAYHIKYLIKDKIKKAKFSRIVFHEITEKALLTALSEQRQIDNNLFDAQQTRRVLDRLFGYKLSPYLWKRFGKRWLSAGRVQSVALRFIVEREFERDKFKKQKTYLIKGQFSHKTKLPIAKLMKLAGKKYFKTQSIPLFDGKYEYQTTLISKQEEYKTEEERLLKEEYKIDKIEESITSRQPPPPFTTSTLQQFASSYLGYSAKRTMRLAQELYEAGLITYHRTDSNYLSKDFVTKMRAYILQKYSGEYLEKKVRQYKTKSKLAQEAHEAIRPTKTSFHLAHPEIKDLRADKYKLYQTIYNRSLATQMSAAKLKNQKIVITSSKEDEFVISNQQVVFPGFLILFDKNKEGSIIQNLKSQTRLKLDKLEIEPKDTQPPPHYNEASLIKTLEAQGIGRPSTYAPIVSLIQERQYVNKNGRELEPFILGIKITMLLKDKFESLITPTFTAKMEDDLDLVALGKKDWQKIVGLYFDPFNQLLEKAYTDTTKIKVEEPTSKKCPKCNRDLVIKISRFGKFYACTGFPDCRYTENYLQSLGVICPKCEKGNVVERRSKKGKKFYACSRYPECDFTSLWLPKLKDKANSEQKQT